MRILTTTVVLTTLLLAPACGGEGGGGDAGPNAPSKEALLQTLRDMSKAVTAGDLEKALTYMAEIPQADVVKMRQSLPKFVEREGINDANIDKLGAKGKYGPLKEIFPKRGKMWAERLKVEVDDCYAIGVGNAEVAGQWTKAGFRLIRADDLNKIE